MKQVNMTDLLSQVMKFYNCMCQTGTATEYVSTIHRGSVCLTGTATKYVSTIHRVSASVSLGGNRG